MVRSLIFPITASPRAKARGIFLCCDGPVLWPCGFLFDGKNAEPAHPFPRSSTRVRSVQPLTLFR